MKEQASEKEDKKKQLTVYECQGEIWSRKWNMEEKRNKVKVFLQENLGLEAAKSLLREHIDQKERT